ncbi:hypothetical protein H4S00_006315, partial [Coemansia sp. D1744]
MSDDILDIIEQEYVLPRSTVANPLLAAAQRSVPRAYRLHEVLALPGPRLGTTLSMARDPVS